jgi:hypothetical protein
MGVQCNCRVNKSVSLGLVLNIPLVDWTNTNNMEIIVRVCEPVIFVDTAARGTVP